MIPNLANLLPTANAESFHNNEAKAFSGTPDQAGERFDQVMAQALSPAAKPGTSADSQNSSGTGTATGAISTVPLETKETAHASENLPVQTTAPAPAPAQTPAPVSEWRNYAAAQNVAGATISFASIAAQPKGSKSGASASGASDAKASASQTGGAASGAVEAVGAAINAAEIAIPNFIPTVVQSAAPVAGRQNSAAGQIVSGAGTGASDLPTTAQNLASASARQNSAVAQNLNGTGGDAVNDSAKQVGSNSTAVDPESVPAAITAPVAQAISAANLAAEVATAFAGAKIVSSAPVKTSAPKTTPSAPPVETSSSVKAAKPERMVSTDKTAAVEEAEATDSKTAGQTGVTAPPLLVANAGAGDLKAPKSPVELAADSQPSNGDSDAIAPASTQSAVNGTPAAQQDVLMKSAEKTNKTTAPAGNFLPSSVVSAGSGNNLPLRADQTGANGAAGLSAPGDSATVTTTGAGTVAIPATTGLSAQSMERMHDLVTQHALRLSNPTDSLQVVIKPGAGTQLSLELRQGGNGVEAHAVLQQGDFNHLNERWSDLQNRLEQRGIRLAPLTDDSASANSNGQTFEQNKNQSAEPRAELAFASSASVTFAQPVARTSSKQGWESWA